MDMLLHYFRKLSKIALYLNSIIKLKETQNQYVGQTVFTHCRMQLKSCWSNTVECTSKLKAQFESGGTKRRVERTFSSHSPMIAPLGPTNSIPQAVTRSALEFPKHSISFSSRFCSVLFLPIFVSTSRFFRKVINIQFSNQNVIK